MSDKNFKVKNGLDANGAVTITQPDTSTTPLTISANTLATGSDLFQVKRPDGTVRFAVGNDGALTVNSNINFNGGNMTMYPANSGQTPLIVFGQTNQSVATLIVRAGTGQSGNVQEWRDQNNNVAVSVGPDFALRGIAGGFFGTANGNIVGVNYLAVKGWAASHIPFVVQGYASQTGDLTRWVDSSANTLAKVDASGSITAVDLTLSGNLTVNGTTTNLNSTNLVIEDKNIILADVTTPTDTTADGAGITIKGATDKTFNWVQASSSFTSSQSLIINQSSATTIGLKIVGNGSNTQPLFRAVNSNNEPMVTIGGPYVGYTFLASGISQFDNNYYGGNATPLIVSQLYGATGTAPTSIFKAGPSGATGDITQWQDSNGNVLAYVTSSGSLTSAGQVAVVNGPVFNNTNNDGYMRPWTSTGSIVIGPHPSGSVSNVILKVKGIASQTGDLQQWQNSAGTVLVKVDKDGGFTAPNIALGTYGGIYAPGSYMTFNTADMRMVTSAVSISNSALGPTAQLHVVNGTAANPGLIVKGAVSQSANLQEWQDSSGTLLGRVAANGTTSWYGGVNQFTGDVRVGTTGYFNGALSVTARVASESGIVVRGYTSQSADLQQWQDSTGTVLARIYNNGAINAGTYNGVTVGLNYPGIVLDTSNGANTQVWLRNLSASTASGRFVGIKARNAYADAVAGDDLVTLAGQQYISGIAYESGKILISNDDSTPSTTSYPGRITFHTTEIGSTTLTERMRISSSGNVLINGSSSSTVGLTVKAAASQTANLQEWKFNNNVIPFNIGPSSASFMGTTASGLYPVGINSPANSNTFLTVGTTGWVSFSSASQVTGIYTRVVNDSSGDIAAVVAQPVTGSTHTNIWAVNASVRSAGISTTNASVFYAASPVMSSGTVTNLYGLYINTQKATGTTNPYGIYQVGVDDLNVFNGRTTINSGAAGYVPLTIKAAASQTANLQEWKNSAGTVLNAIDFNGSFIGGQFDINGNLSNINYLGPRRALFSGNIYGQSVSDEVKLLLCGQLNQSSDFFQIRDQGGGSGVVLAKFDAKGVLTAPAINVVGQSVSSNTTMISGYRYFVDTTAARTLTLPASPSVGAEVQIFDSSNSAGTYNITIDPNSAKIEGVVEQYLIDVNGAAVTMTYTGSTFGWKVRS